MSQQRMDYDEGNRQQQEPRLDNYESGYRDPFTGTYTGQKLAQQGSWSSNAPGGNAPRLSYRLGGHACSFNCHHSWDIRWRHL